MKIPLAVGLFVFLVLALPLVYAQPQLAVSVSPSSLSVPQGSVASYMVSLTGSREAMEAPTYSLSVDGLPGGAQGSFGSNPVTLSAAGYGGAASTSLSLDTSYTPLYCPGTYPFTVTASGSSSVSASSGPASLMVTQVGPSLQVSVSSDEPSYISGQTITITITANRPAEGTLTVTPPSGAPRTYPFSFALGETYSTTETLTAAQPYGTWTMNVQADDYCGVMSNASGQFTVGPNTYNVYISLSGLPATLVTGLKVDGASQGKIGGSQNKTLSFKIGTQHTISVDQYVNASSTSRYYDLQNTWTVTATASHVFSYQLRYLLTEEVGIFYGNEMITFPSPCCGNTTVHWISFTSTNGSPLNMNYWYPVGTVLYPKPVSTIVYNPYPNGTRLVSVGWQLDGVNQTVLPTGASSASTITMNGPHTVIYMYALQYRLWVVSEYGNPQLPGNGNWSAGVPYYTTNQVSNPTVVSSWYDAGIAATASVTSPVGFTIQHVFQYWLPNSTSSSTSPSISVVMDGPTVLTAEWSTSYTLLYYEIAGGISVAAVIALAAKYFGHGLHLRRPPSSGPVEEPVEEV